MTTESIPDLWPELHIPSEFPPVVILRHQGHKLGERTGNTLYGQVRSHEVERNYFRHEFELVAPFLGFRRRILSLSHPLAYYPATIELLGSQDDVLQTQSVVSADELVSTLRTMLQHPTVVNLVQSLIVQSRDLEES
jgi:hypothetical protein